MVDESPGAPPVGSVAEETARLIDALFGGEAAGPPPRQPAPPAPPEAKPEAGGRSTGEQGTRHTEVCGSCGQQVGSESPGASADPASSVCHLCPVCQLISAVRSVRPETVERLADLAAAVTQALRDVAATRWAESGQPAAQRHRSTVEDIDVHDEDDEDDEDDDDGPTDHPTDEETQP